MRILNSKANPYLLVFIFFVASVGIDVDVQAAEGNHFQTLQERLVADGFSPEDINTLFKNPAVSFDAKGVSRFFRHSEAKLRYDQFYSRKSIRAAKKYMEKHKKDLLAAERTYGVDKEVITAIILVETRLGKLTGKSSIINTLSTMAALSDPRAREAFWQVVSNAYEVERERFDKWVDRKSKWAYAELTAFLKYTSQEKVDPIAVLGSYAGAFGYAQFMPSSILAYAADGDSDGDIDLFTHADAIASVANYLKKHGWRPEKDEKAKKKVVWTYNRSSYYVDTIFEVSKRLKG